MNELPVRLNILRLTEIKEALFDIDEQKAPGPDGFSAKFFKAAWNIIGKDMCLAVQEFFQTGKLLGNDILKVVGVSGKEIQFPLLVHYVTVIKQALEDFSNVSGLNPHLKKALYSLGVLTLRNKTKFCKFFLSPLENFQSYTLGYHLSLNTKKDYMWVKWIYEERLKGTSIWKIEHDARTSWGWRNLLKIRDKIGHHIWHTIENGKNTVI
uniref:RNA-directed DNA polymerase, eukaryota, reverse transcriptase zinc-binding domain protein n=1 Tax=Tanacetum cinerariifolium TaxID=118510 RepID=A0A6L2JPP0_TANCI|nr:RNA-directed DNA polymerase, eukaryota, reverse transcriptase zinc-binding domain protein [Tanacetum cinerariifolium]